MMEWLPKLPSWIAGLTGFGVFSWILLAIFAPTALTVVSSFLVSLSPLLKGLADAVVEVIKHLWEGMKDMMDNFSSILFVIAVAIIAYFSATAKKEPLQKVCKPVIEQLRKDYTFVPKNKGRGWNK